MLLLATTLVCAARAADSRRVLDARYLESMLARADSVALVSQRQRSLADTLFGAARQRWERLQPAIELFREWGILELRLAKGAAADQVLADRRLLLGKLAAAGWPTEEGAETPYALQQHLSGGLEEIILLLLETHLNHPWHQNAMDYLISAYAQLGRVVRSADVLDQCLLLFQHAIQRNSRSYVAHIELARIHHEQGRHRLALEAAYEAEEHFLLSLGAANQDPAKNGLEAFRLLPREGEGLESSELRRTYLVILQEQYSNELEAGLSDNGLATLQRMEPFLPAAERKANEQAVRELAWGGTPESRLSYQKAIAAERNSEFDRAVELYRQSLAGARTAACRQQILFDLAYLHDIELGRTAEAIQLYRLMAKEIPPSHGDLAPADTTQATRWRQFGRCFFEYALQLDNAGRPSEALALYQEAASVTQPSQASAMLAMAALQQAQTSVALPILQSLESMLTRGSWGLPTEARDRLILKRGAYKLLMDLHRRLGRHQEADHYRKLAEATYAP